MIFQNVKVWKKYCSCFYGIRFNDLQSFYCSYTIMPDCVNSSDCTAVTVPSISVWQQNYFFQNWVIKGREGGREWLSQICVLFSVMTMLLFVHKAYKLCYEGTCSRGQFIFCSCLIIKTNQGFSASRQTCINSSSFKTVLEIPFSGICLVIWIVYIFGLF